MQIFDDQYIATGGQMAELIRGHDRFCCDVRPLTDEIAQSHGFPPSTVCHPYDMAGMLVAEQAGVIVCDPRGSSLDAPFDVTTPIGWCGYANRQLYRTISRIVDDWVFDLGHGKLDYDDEDDARLEVLREQQRRS